MECPQCKNHIVVEELIGVRSGIVRSRVAVSGARYESNRVGLFFLSTILFTLLSIVVIFLLTAFSSVFEQVYSHPALGSFLLLQCGLPIMLGFLLTIILFKIIHVKVNWSGVPVVRCKKCGFRLGGFFNR
ncbi:MAG TPA: hypothetical protein VGF67_34080 [Ktedonobacteraceae bacterium]|jgi:hypothetical protein